METLSQASFSKAVSYLETNARPLEQALCRHIFGDGPVATVVTELAAYQNPDGGFGHALEPDLRAPDSSALCTSFALGLLMERGVPSDEAMVRSAVQYLENTFDSDTRVWRMLPPNTDAYPHAPWWNQDGLDSAFGDFLENPRVKLCGFLYHWEDVSAPQLRAGVLQDILTHLETREDGASGDDLLVYLWFCRCANIPDNARAAVEHKLSRMIPAAVELDRSKWDEYCLKPVRVVETPDSPFLPLVQEFFDDSLDYEIEHQDDDGSWTPFWSWDDAYPEAWTEAEREWRGVLTLTMLRKLRAFGRIAP